MYSSELIELNKIIYYFYFGTYEYLFPQTSKIIKMAYNTNFKFIIIIMTVGIECCRCKEIDGYKSLKPSILTTQSRPSMADLLPSTFEGKERERVAYEKFSNAGL